MKRLLFVLPALLFLLATANPFRAQQGPIRGCYQKNNGQLRFVQAAIDCQASELAVAWNGKASAIAGKKPGAGSITAVPTLGGTINIAYAINDRGEVTGSSRLNGDLISHSFLARLNGLIDLSPFNSGVPQTIGPTSINNHGQITSGLVVNQVYFPAVFDSLAQTITTLGTFGGVSFAKVAGVATAINNKGQVVGYSFLDEFNRHAFLYANGALTDLGSFGGYSEATDINENGTIVGLASNTVNGFSHAFTYSNGVMTDINPFGGNSFSTIQSQARSVNNRGDIVGEGLIPGGGSFHAFLNRNGAVTDLGTLPDGRNSYAKGINESGLIVGMADVPYQDTCFGFPCTLYKLVAVAYVNGTLIDLNNTIPSDSGWELLTAHDVNNRGQIVGEGLFNGKLRAFVLQ